MLALFFVAAIPVIACRVLRSELGSFFISAPWRVIVLVANMIHLESMGPGSDFDIVFAIACFVWASIQVFVYAAFFFFV